MKHLVKGLWELLPLSVRRLVVHEVRALYSIWLWLLRRRHGIGPGEHAAGYTAPQTATMWAWVFISLVETVALAVIIPWPLVHAITLYTSLYGLVLMVGIQAACVTRPHVVGADGSLRLRFGALFDLRIPAGAVTRVRIDRRFPEGRMVQPRDDGSLELIVGSQTTLAVELAEPLTYVRPLGRRGTAHTIRFHADDPAALMEALTRRTPAGSGPAGSGLAKSGQAEPEPA
ncbi:hypothetical protein ACFYT4_01680 [Streptomyces sp. NPDC004609]|uniref:hypothetical protein n=1 Tax=Streptomyces sp. NPDC004609 TaxID=3364704 RepID=UPI00369EBB9B